MVPDDACAAGGTEFVGATRVGGSAVAAATRVVNAPRVSDGAWADGAN